MIRIVDIQDAWGHWYRRDIRVTDGVNTVTSTMVLKHESDFVCKWAFYAFGKSYELVSKLVDNGGNGGCGLTYQIVEA